MLPLLLVLAAIAPVAPAEQEPEAPRAEEVASEATRTAQALCSALQGRDFDRVRASLSAHFSAEGLGGAALDGAAFPDALAQHLASAALVRRCSFKPFQFATDRAHGRAVARLALVISGQDVQGQRFSDRGDVDAELVREEGALRFARLEFLPRTWTRGGAPEFTDVTEALGLSQDFAEPPLKVTPGPESLLERGGLAVADYDGDGDLDLYVARDGANLLYRNDGHGHFTEVAREAGVADPGNSRGVLWVDLDNDGDLDLFVANWARPGQRGNRLYRNDGNGRFTDVTEWAGVGQVGPFTSVVAADVDGDGLLDLYVCGYQYHTVKHAPFDAHTGHPNLLLHNLGNLRFEEIGAKAGVAGREWSYAAALADLDGDLKPELLVVNDYGSPRLYRNRSTPGRVRFEEVTEAAGLVDPGNGMGVDVGDYDGDGLPDLAISKMYSKAGNRLLSQAVAAPEAQLEVARRGARGDSLFRNLGGLRFEEVGEAAGVRRAGWAWSCEWGDVDNDGDLDLYVSNGFLTGPSEDDL